MARFLSTNHNSLLRIATNEIALFRINHRSRQMSQMAFFRAKAGQRRGKKPAFAFCFEIKRVFVITGASQRLEPVITYSLFLSFFQSIVSRAPFSAVTKPLS